MPRDWKINEPCFTKFSPHQYPDGTWYVHAHNEPNHYPVTPFPTEKLAIEHAHHLNLVDRKESDAFYLNKHAKAKFDAIYRASLPSAPLLQRIRETLYSLYNYFPLRKQRIEKMRNNGQWHTWACRENPSAYFVNNLPTEELVRSHAIHSDAFMRKKALPDPYYRTFSGRD